MLAGIGPSYHDRHDVCTMITRLPSLLMLATVTLSPPGRPPINKQAGPAVVVTVDREVTGLALSLGGRTLAVTTGDVPFPNQRLRPSDLWLFDAKTRRKLSQSTLGGWMQ